MERPGRAHRPRTHAVRTRAHAKANLPHFGPSMRACLTGWRTRWPVQCALAVGGEVRCWGDNDDANEATPPVGVSLESIALGNDTSCGTAVGTGVPVCWGLNNHRQAEVPFNAVRGCFGFDT